MTVKSVHESSEAGEGAEALRRLRNKLAEMFDTETDPLTATRLADRISSLTEQLGDSEDQPDPERDSPAQRMREKYLKNSS